MLHQIGPSSNAPLSEDLAGRTVAGFLRDRLLGDPPIPGLPEDIVDVVDMTSPDGSKPTVPVAAPVYRCTGWVARTGQDTELGLSATGSRRRPLGTIRGAAGQGGYWMRHAGSVADAAARWTATGGTVRAQRESALHWTVTLTGPAADAAADETNLSRPAGLSTRTLDCVTYVDITFRAADHAARRVFAQQDAQLRLTARVPDDLPADAARAAVAAARERYELSEADLTEENVLDLLWRHGNYRHIYALRGDFAGYV
jgi:hypothetical protein